MKRDNDLIRQLLLEAEAEPTPYIIIPFTHSSDQEDVRRNHHADLLCDAGLFTNPSKDMYRLTNQGYDFISSFKIEGNWQKIKALAGHLSLASMKAVGDKLLEKALDEVIKHI